MNAVTVYLMPVSFGYGPAALAVAVAGSMRERHPHLQVAAVADSLAAELLAASGALAEGQVITAAAGQLPDSPAAGGRSIWVGFADFDRLRLAVERNLPSIMVDPLWWMWDEPPALLGAGLLRYLALRFPGIEQTVPADTGPTFRIVPQVVEAGIARQPSGERSGMLLNLGGGVVPGIEGLTYLQSVIDVVASCCAGTEVLVASSAEVIECLNAPEGPARLQLRALHQPEMIRELRQRARLITVPGQSIIWEALSAEIPTVIVPGFNYSQHCQSAFYRAELHGTPVLAWDALPGYQLAPAGLPEYQGLAYTSDIGRRFATDHAARDRMRAWLSAALRRPATPPTVAEGSAWSDLSGAEVIADEIAAAAATLADPGRRVTNA